MGTPVNLLDIDIRHETQIVDGDGNFNEHGMKHFVTQTRFAEHGVSYTVVAIMGPQSGGKSTLLNHLFDTNFVLMNSSKGRSQTTRGIWLARAAHTQGFTFVMDVEGTDGRERGQDDTKFEKQSTLFALAVSDVLMLNMWIHDVGRDSGASKPLLRIVFQAMTKLFRKPRDLRKKTLMFVIRDHDQEETPLERLTVTLGEDIQQIWRGVEKPEPYRKAQLNELFNIQVVGIPHYRYKFIEFKDEVARLKQRLVSSAIRERRDFVSDFSQTAIRLWSLIKDNKDLDLPSLRILISSRRCDDIIAQLLNSFVHNQEWIILESKLKSEPVPGFGKQISTMLSSCLSSYDEETCYYDKETTSSKRKTLQSKLFEVVWPSYRLMLRHISSKTFQSFVHGFDKMQNKKSLFCVMDRPSMRADNFLDKFDKKVEEDASIKPEPTYYSEERAQIRDELRRSIDNHIKEIRTISAFENLLKEALYSALSKTATELLIERPGSDTWPKLRRLLMEENENIKDKLSKELTGFENDEEIRSSSISKLQNYGRSIIEDKAKLAATEALYSLRKRFKEVFSHDDNLKPKQWGMFDDVEKHVEPAHTKCLEVLCVLAAIRLDDDDYVIIERTLSDILDSRGGDVDKLNSDRWNEVPPSATLLTPAQCKYMWTNFKLFTKQLIKNAKRMVRGKQAAFSLTIVAGVSIICAACAAATVVALPVAVGAAMAAVPSASAVLASAGAVYAKCHNTLASESEIGGNLAIPDLACAIVRLKAMEILQNLVTMLSISPELCTQLRYVNYQLFLRLDHIYLYSELTYITSLES